MEISLSAPSTTPEGADKDIFSDRFKYKKSPLLNNTIKYPSEA
jgi:hypothetical protein